MSEGANVTGIDLSENLIFLANENTKLIEKGTFNGRCENLLEMSYVILFDFILFVNVLLHTDDSNAILSKAKDLLKYNEKILIIEYNPLNPLFIIFFILIGQLSSNLTINYCKSNIFTLTKLFNNQNFIIHKIIKYGYFPNSTYNISSFFIILNKLLNSISVINLFSAFHFILISKL